MVERLSDTAAAVEPAGVPATVGTIDSCVNESGAPDWSDAATTTRRWCASTMVRWWERWWLASMVNAKKDPPPPPPRPAGRRDGWATMMSAAVDRFAALGSREPAGTPARVGICDSVGEEVGPPRRKGFCVTAGALAVGLAE